MKRNRADQREQKNEQLVGRYFMQDRAARAAEREYEFNNNHIYHSHVEKQSAKDVGDKQNSLCMRKSSAGAQMPIENIDDFQLTITHR